MTIDDTLENATMMSIGTSADQVREVIQKRLDFIEDRCGIEPGGLVRITDSAYQAIADLTQASPGLALEVMKRAMPSAEQLIQDQPYVITEERIQSLGLTYDTLVQYWDSPLRGAVFFDMESR